MRRRRSRWPSASLGWGAEVFPLVLSSVRARRVSFAGSLVPLTLAVALVCAAATLMAGVLGKSGAGRFAAVGAVVQGNATVKVGRGNSASVVTVHPSQRLPYAIVPRVASVSGVARAVGDVAFPVTAFDLQGRVLSAPGADRTEAHGSSSAILTPYVVLAGRPPLGADEVVLDARLADRDRLLVGKRVRIVTPAGGREFRISGIASSGGRGDRGQSALFFSDPVARRLAGSPGQVNAVGVLAGAGVDSRSLRARLRRALGTGVNVLDRRHAADADAGDPRAAQREDAIGFLGTLGALGAVVAVFVVGGTFALAINQRRRELALLRAIGATPRQVRRLIAGEALVLAVLGGVLARVAGLPLAAEIGRGLVDHGVAPQGLHTGANPVALFVAAASGLLVAEIAVIAAARRAARIPPSEALLEAAVEPRTLGLGRSLLGLAALAGAGVMLALFSGESAFAFAEITVLLLATALALLAPQVLALPAAALSWPLRAGASGLLAGRAIATHRRRVGAIAAAVLLVVALAGTYAIINASNRAATQDATALRVHAPFVLVARSGGGLPVATEQLADRVAGVTAAVGALPTQVFLLDPGLDNFGSPWDAAGVGSGAISAHALDLGVRSGSPVDLRGNAIAISSELARKRDLHVGDILHARLADTTQTVLRVRAIYDHALGLGDVLLPMPLAAAHAPAALDNAIFVAGPPAIRVGLTALTRTIPTLRLLTRRQYLGALRTADQASAWIVWLLIAVIGAFAGLAVVNTSAMALADRRPELNLIRLIGATRQQARRMIAWEAAITTLVGAAAGALSARLAAARIAEGRPGWHVVIPPTLFGGILAGAAALGLLGSLLPAQLALHPRPVTSLDQHE